MKAPFLLQMLTVRGHTFMPSPLGESSIVMDLGAHLGEFSGEIFQSFRCRCIAVEPNPVLIEKVRIFEGIEPEWAAVTQNDGEIELRIDDNAESSNVLIDRNTAWDGRRICVPARKLETLFKQFGIIHIDIMKMDIEGAEVQVLLSTPDRILRSIDQISVEFHDFCGLVTPAELSAVRSRLASLGFVAMRFGPANMNWLFVRRGAVGLGYLRRGYVKHLVRNARNMRNWVRARSERRHNEGG